MSVYDQVANDFGPQNKTTIDDRNGTQLRIIGRLKPGMTAAAAKPALEGLAANLEKAYPVEQKDQTFTVRSVPHITVSKNPAADSGLKPIAPLLLGMAVVVLLVACLNLANMLLARGTARRKEIAIRLALGGNRWRIVRQLLSEGFVLARARRRRWTHSWILVVRSAGWLNAKTHAFRHCVVDRTKPRNFGGNVSDFACSAR